ncbi:MAG: TerC/Alx family metal homeostasis membrane protein [archaeon]|nr:TerC/Alx family metal homeostasis membrane protein [archaeon]
MSETELWIIFAVLFTAILLTDLLRSGSRNDRGRSAVVYISVALAFGVLVTLVLGTGSGSAYFAAYAIEMTMSVDNLFVFILLFALFRIPTEHQHRVLFWGIIGVLAFRAVFILVGANILEMFPWTCYVFGAVLILSAVKTVMPEKEGRESRIAGFMIGKGSSEIRSGRFVERIDGRLVMTPLLLCLITIELTDLMFAFDSVPAALSISTDVFIVYTSNMFAVLGLRSLFPVVNGALSKLRYMKYGLCVILVFAGLKMILSEWVHIDPVVSLGITVGVLAVTALASARAPDQ